MNKARRDRIRKAISQMETARDLLDDVREEEQDAMENIPENLQESERYERMEDAVDLLYDAVSDLEEVVNSLNAII